MERRGFITGLVLAPFAALAAKLLPKVQNGNIIHWTSADEMDLSRWGDGVFPPELYGRGVSPDLIAYQHRLNYLYWTGAEWRLPEDTTLRLV